MKAQWKSLLAAMCLAAVFSLAGCDGDTGPAGPQGDQGLPGADGTDGVDATIDPIASAKVESCGTCHSDVGEEAHQALYDKYTDTSNLTLSIDSVASVAAATGFDVTAQFTVKFNNQPYGAGVTANGSDLVGLDDTRILAAQNTAGTAEYVTGCSLSSLAVVNAATGQYSATGNCSFQPETSNGEVYGYLIDTPIFEHAGGTGAEFAVGTHVHLYDDVANAALAFGAPAATSLANVAGCQRCHGTPYMKHGYRAAIVEGIPDFAACKTCHLADRAGSHRDWQFMVDDPFAWATGGAQTNDYSYQRVLMNDVHMSHAMEFPYPMSMANCATCHEGKLTSILADTNFSFETCKSCHALDGVDAWGPQADGTPAEPYYQGNRPPPLRYLWSEKGVTFHDPVAFPNCQGCHGAGAASSLTAYHSGYDKRMANAAGQKYADLYTVSIDDIYLDATNANLLTIELSASDPAIVPNVYVSFYGWDTKDFLVSSHSRDANGERLEYEVGTTDTLFTTTPGAAPDSWIVTLDMSAYVATQTADIPTLIAQGDVKKLEVTIAPQLSVTDPLRGTALPVGLTAVNQTFDLGTGLPFENYFKGTNAIVDSTKCLACHEQLGVTFHYDRGRGGDISVCRNCHVTTSGGSHLEMQSRSIDSYVHAIHSFQVFDPADEFNGRDPVTNAIVADFDPVKAKRYDLHINPTFPTFTIRNCEACHIDAGVDPDGNGPLPPNPVTYNVPDQSKSMPGLLSGSDAPLTWYDKDDPSQENPAGRNISSNIGEYVTGPASRACGGCHRADLINADAAGALASFNAHTEAGGTYVENDAADDNLYGIIEKIMSMFE